MKDKLEVVMMTRVTQQEKKKIEENARKRGQSASAYIRACSLAGRECKSSRKKRLVSAKVEYSEEVNSFMRNYKNGKISREDFEKMAIEMMEKGEKLVWEN